MKKLLGGLVALYVAGLFVVFGVCLHGERAADDKQRRAIELGEANAKVPTGREPLLADACKGKLTPGSAKTVALYVAKMKWPPALKDEYAHVDRTLVATNDVFRVQLSDRFYENLTVSPRPWGQVFEEQLNPVDWARHVTWALAGDPELNAVRYLVVARYESLTLPSVSDDGYTKGAGEYGAMVLTYPAGDVLCEGRGHVRMTERVSASGRDQREANLNAQHLVEFVFTKSATVSPLQEVCDAGGEALCELTRQWVGR